MLINLREVYRPKTAEAALALWQRDPAHTRPLAGGTALLGRDNPAITTLIDLQDLGWDEQRVESGLLRLGAMTRLQTVAGGKLPAGPVTSLLAEAARHSAFELSRNAATLGGAIAQGTPHDDLLLALLALDARLHVYTPKARTVSLPEFWELSRTGLALIAEVEISLPHDDWRYGIRRLGRTPADVAIVNVIAVLYLAKGVCQKAALAMGGVADRPVRLPSAETLLVGTTRPGWSNAIPWLEAVVPQTINPPADFRGSSDYRRAMAGRLVIQAITAAWTGT